MTDTCGTIAELLANASTFEMYMNVYGTFYEAKCF